MKTQGKVFKLVILIVSILVFSISGGFSNDVSAATWTKYGNFKKMKANNGYKYNLFHDYYVEELAMGKTVRVYFNLSKVSDKKIRKATKSILSSLKKTSNKKIKIYTSRPKKKGYYEVKVRDYKNGAKCYTKSALACATYDSLDIVKNITKHKYTLADYKAIIMHETLHVFGISHTKKSKGTLMASRHKRVKSFNFKKYYNDVSAWKTLNSPYRTTTKKHKKIKKRTQRFLNYYASAYFNYTKNGKYLLESGYYLNGKMNKKIYRSATKKNPVKRINMYATNGKYYLKSKYYSNGKLTKLVKRPGTKKNPAKSVYYYGSNGKYLTSAINFESNGKTVSSRIIYANNSSNSVVRKYSYIKGKISNDIKYSQNNKRGLYYKEWEIIYKNGRKSEMIYYVLAPGGTIKSRIIYADDGVTIVERIDY